MKEFEDHLDYIDQLSYNSSVFSFSLVLCIDPDDAVYLPHRTLKVDSCILTLFPLYWLGSIGRDERFQPLHFCSKSISRYWYGDSKAFWYIHTSFFLPSKVQRYIISLLLKGMMRSMSEDDVFYLCLSFINWLLWLCFVYNTTIMNQNPKNLDCFSCCLHNSLAISQNSRAIS